MSSERVTNKTAGGAIFLAALLYSLTPAIIHYTAQGSNPFYFNAIYLVAHSLVLLVVLVVGKIRWIDGTSPTPITYKSLFRLMLLYFRRERRSDKQQETAVTIDSAKLKQPLSLLKSPLVWLFLSNFQYAFFAWSTQYVETAIASTIYELWPAIVVYGLMRHAHTDKLYRTRPDPSIAAELSRSTERKVLTVFASIGLIFMLGSQHDGSIKSPLELLTFESLLGILLAIIACTLGVLNVLSSLSLGQILFYYVVDGSATGSSWLKETPGDRSAKDRRILLWLTLFGMIAVRVAVVPASVISGLLMSDNVNTISGRGILGALVLAVALATATVLLRIGNIGSDNPGINALFFTSPFIALFILMGIGITLPRFDLFLTGAALILAINVLMQIKPDEERDFERLGKERQQGGRLGFTVFILSIWVFGTAVLLRDKVFPKTRLIWTLDEYWSLLALAATIFALILGFRVARLSSRLAQEDEMMLNLFRDCEDLVRQGRIDPAVLDTLMTMDTARPRELLETYNSVREKIRESLRQDDNGNNAVAAVQKQLDLVAHSKQQGRDIVELISLVAFAAVTAGIGLLARPNELIAAHTWSGFLSEVFIVLFVSTVVFLCANLFDIRRDRQIPLIVQPKELDGDRVLFFRHKRSLSVQHIAAIAVSIAMTITFCALLYSKWLTAPLS